MIVSRTPFRVSLFGGNTDRPEWFKDHGGEVLGFTIDKYCWITLRRLPPFFDYRHRIVYSDIELVSKASEIKHPVVRAVMQKYVSTGIEMHHDGDLPARSGLGSSSAFTVGLLNAFHAFNGHRVAEKALAMEAIHVERDLLHETVGYQDQIWAAHGGFSHVKFHHDGTYEVQPVIARQTLREALEAHLMLFFTGFSRFGEASAAAQVANFSKKEVQLRHMQGMVMEAVFALQTGDIDTIGELLHRSWCLKRDLADTVSTGPIDEIYAAARDAGATGGKLLGAGGGGFMLLFAPLAAQRKIREKLKPLIEVQFKIGSPGSQIVLYEPEGL